MCVFIVRGIGDSAALSALACCLSCSWQLVRLRERGGRCSLHAAVSFMCSLFLVRALLGGSVIFLTERSPSGWLLLDEATGRRGEICALLLQRSGFKHVNGDYLHVPSAGLTGKTCSRTLSTIRKESLGTTVPGTSVHLTKHKQSPLHPALLWRFRGWFGEERSRGHSSTRGTFTTVLHSS